MKYYAKNKRKMFPEIIDWSDPQNKWRYEQNVRDMKWNFWFWFQPDAYKLIQYGTSVINILAFSGLGLLFYIKENSYLFIASLFFLIYFIYDMEKKRKNMKILPKDYNMYDLYMREYVGSDIK